MAERATEVLQVAQFRRGNSMMGQMNVVGMQVPSFQVRLTLNIVPGGVLQHQAIRISLNP